MTGFPTLHDRLPRLRALHPDSAAVAALTNLALLTGNVGREGAGVNPLVSDSNSLGANDMGCQPGMFPGYRP